MVSARLNMSPRCALISNWVSHILVYVRTVVPADRGVAASIIGPQIRGDIKKQEMEQRRAAKSRRQTAIVYSDEEAEGEMVANN